jgi:hypothetical protein
VPPNDLGDLRHWNFPLQQPEDGLPLILGQMAVVMTDGDLSL